ncbi:protein LURP-one-related 15-like isoform X1 [Populus alba x Populus x berolinensis]|nr:protein LURP-one-related 15-like isoform X1 [Populus alba x Populus x berolinensis]
MATGQAPSNPVPAMRTYPPVEHPVVVIGPQYLAQYPVELAVSPELWSLGENDFKVSDINGTLIFQVKSKLLSMPVRRFLKDAAGNTLVNLRQKIMTMHRSWEAFRGESKEEKDLLFTAKKSKLFQFKTDLDVFLGNNKGEVPDFKVKEGYSESSCSILLGDSNTMLAQVHGRHILAIMPNVDYAFIVALVVVILYGMNANDAAIKCLNGVVDEMASMHRKHSLASTILDTDSFGVTVYPNVDYAFITALVVILDEINADRSGED